MKQCSMCIAHEHFKHYIFRGSVMIEFSENRGPNKIFHISTPKCFELWVNINKNPKLLSEV